MSIKTLSVRENPEAIKNIQSGPVVSPRVIKNRQISIVFYSNYYHNVKKCAKNRFVCNDLSSFAKLLIFLINFYYLIRLFYYL